MKKADLLSKMATLLAATDHLPDDADITVVSIGVDVTIYSDFFPVEFTDEKDGKFKYADAHGVTFGKQGVHDAY